MLRSLLCASLLLAACAPAATNHLASIAPVPSSLALAAAAGGEDARVAEHIGTWSGRSYLSGAAAKGAAWELVQRRVEGGVAGVISWPGSTTEATPVRTLYLRSDSFVYEFGPFYSETLGEVTGRAVGRIQGDRMSGTFELRPVKGNQLFKGRFEGTRAAGGFAARDAS